jgi:hypothetical protein
MGSVVQKSPLKKRDWRAFGYGVELTWAIKGFEKERKIYVYHPRLLPQLVRQT